MRARSEPILDEHRRGLLRAALGEGQRAAEAFQAWRGRVRLDDIDASAFRVLAHLVETAIRSGIDDPALPRIRGAAKHTWVNNMRRAHALGEALEAIERTGVDVMLLKGGALFARYPHLASLRVAEDYDLLVRHLEAPRAVQALIGVGYRPRVARADLFTAADFNLVHGVHFARADREGSLDLHWWPLPRWRDHQCVGEMFANAEVAAFAGRRVTVPSLADQLFLALARPEPWEADEVFLRAVEATHVLRCSGGRLDWDRFLGLVGRRRCQAMAVAMLDLVRIETGAAAPDAVVDRLAAASAAYRSRELSLRGRPPFARTSLDRFALRAIEIARSRPDGSTSRFGALLACLRRGELRVGIVRAAREELPGLRASRNLERVWSSRAGREVDFSAGAPAFVEGFSFPEDQGRWTDGETAVLAQPVNAEPDLRVDIRLTVLPFLPLGARTFAFKACGGIGMTEHHVLSVERGIPASVSIGARVLGNDRPRVVLALRLLDAARPLELGLSDDPRHLGLMILGMARLPRLQPGEIPERVWSRHAECEIALATPGPIFLQGFSIAEDRGRWTDGETAVLALPVDAEPDGRVGVRLTVMPFFPPGAKTFAFEACGGMGITEHHVLSVEQGVPATVSIGARVLGNGPPRAMLVLRLLDAARPTELGLSDDRRLLGLMISSVEQEPKEEIAAAAHVDRQP